MASRVTSHDVATRAGVSRSAVSMILNNSSGVTFSEATRERVLKAAAELGYTPNSAARMLVRGATETIGIVISDAGILPHDGFVPMLMHGISQVNREHGYHVLLEGLNAGNRPNPYEGLVKARRIDGLIVLNPRIGDPHITELIERKFPIVLAGSIRHPDEYSVNFTIGDSIARAVDLLVEMGHRRIGTVQFSGKDFVATDMRLSDQRQALGRHGLDLPEHFIEYGNFTAESGYDAGRRLLERQPELTAILAGNDTIAIGVLSAAAALGRRVPDDLSVVGFDDLPFAPWVNPALTTVHLDAVEQGVQAGRLLIKLLRNEPIEVRQMLLPTTFVPRKSCAPPR